VTLTRDDDKPELMDILKSDIFPRMRGVDHDELLYLVEDWLHTGQPHSLRLSGLSE
jgi:hypothetical protein